LRSALLLALPLAASACIPDAQGFDEAYLKTWCEAWQDQCTTVLADDPCRGTGAPTISISPPDLDACVYHRAKAGTCLDPDRWSCEVGDDGQEQLVRPDACDEVWTCP
jgi:hypothetical protein